MKMTDESALAVLDSICDNGMDKPGLPSFAALHSARDYLRTRLAADQQKGGGEVAEYQSQVTDKATGKVVHPWSHCGRAAYDAAKGQPHEGSRLRVEYRKLYTTPQPSIPAPAQQDGKASGGEYLFTSDEVNEAIELLRFHSSIVTEAIDHMEACLLANADDALAHPPHADQETQG